MNDISKGTHAANLAARGFNVFQLRPNSKEPAIHDWPNRSTRDAGKVARAWTNEPERNIAIHTDTHNGAPIFVLDIDDKAGKNGSAELALLEAKHGKLPETLTTVTPSGGRHLFFYCQGAVGNSAGKVAPSIDVRGSRGYVAAPGSTINGKAYAFADPNKRIVQAPAWLYKLVRDTGTAAEPAPIDRTPLPGVDANRATARALAYLASAPLAIEGSAGDSTTFRVAAALKDQGCTEAQALDLMAEHWNDRCSPPWALDDLAAKIQHAYKYGKEQPGIDAPEAVFAAAPPPSEPPKQAPLFVTRVSDVQAKPIAWLWPKVFALGKHSQIAGNPGLGKSQLSIFLAAAVSTGGALPDGSTCPSGDVLMITMEDDIADTIRPRLEAAGADLNRIGIVEGVPVKLASGQDGVRSFDLTMDVQRLAEVADSLPDLRLIIVDPISAFMGATDSHKNAEVRSALTAISKLAESRSAALISINHLNKSSNSEAMSRVNGSGAFVAQARAVYIVTRDKDDETVRVMSPLKNNVGDDLTAFFFKVEGVTLASGIATSRAAWLDRTEELGADEALDLRKPKSDKSAVAIAQGFIMEQLRDGPRPAKDVTDAARDAGISGKTLRNARERLNVLSEKEEGKKNGVFLWSLPQAMPEKRDVRTAEDIFN